METNLSKKKFVNIFFPVLLVVVSVFLCFRNYTPGTFLTGWDTLHPEFNYKVYWHRIIFGAWQSHQGLGAVASQAHASEIPRVILISLINLFFSMDKVRYFYAFLMLILGPLGIYFYLKKIILEKFSENASSVGSFTGGLFYLLNLGTLQHFNVPLEMFLTHYGLLGWSFLFLTKFYLNGRRKDLFIFVLISIFSTSQAHTPTLFYVYLMSILIYLCSLIITNKKELQNKKRLFLTRSLILFAVTLSVNLFWFLPHLYYAFSKGSEVSLSKIHHLFSDEAFLVNKKYGNIKDTALLKNFLFNWGVYGGENFFVDLLNPWIIHLRKPLVCVVGYIMFGFILIGLIVSLVKKNRYSLSWLLLGLVGVFFIFNVNPPFGFIFQFLQNNISLFKEVFRFPFTKFSTILMVAYSIFFGYFAGFVSEFVQNKLGRVCPFIVLLVLSSSLIYFSFPAFNGDLINKYMRVSIPNRYFEMFKYFDEQDEYGRVAELPTHSFWGWVFHSWNSAGTGYQGAGFLWFGIKQPLLDREFDRWNILNEQPYRELSTAVYSEDSVMLINVLNKYKIRWLIVDKSVVAPGLDQKVLFYKEIENLLSSINNITLERDFGEGLLVYKYSPKTSFSRLEVIDKPFVTNSSLFKEYYDPIYSVHGNYVSGKGVEYPFLGVNHVDENISNDSIYSDEDFVYLKVPSGASIVGELPVVPVRVYLRSNDSGNYFVDITFNGESINKVDLLVGDRSGVVIKIGTEVFDVSNVDVNSAIGDVFVSPSKGLEVTVYKSDGNVSPKKISYSSLENCDTMRSGYFSSYSVSMIDNGFKITAKDTLACLTVPLSDVLSSETSSLVSVKLDSPTGVNADSFCMLDDATGLCVDFFEGDKFLSIIREDVNSYSLRFFSDARNEKGDVVKEFNNIKIGTYNSVLNTSVDVSLDNLNIDLSSLAFSKQKQFTVHPTEIPGNRRSCKRGVGLGDSNFISSEKGLIFNSTKGSLCDSYEFPLAYHNTGYVLEVKAKHYSGVPLRLCLTNEYSKRCDLDVSLPSSNIDESFFYFIPPMGDGVGYTLNVSNYVFGDTLSRNELEYLSLVPVSYNLIKNITVGNSTNSPDQTYVLNEAYDDGWLALCGWKVCGAEHVKVNNWANGWVFNRSVPSGIMIVFWPQILGFVGFSFLVLVLLLSFRYKEKDST